MVTSVPNEKTNFVILRGVKEHNQFFSDYKVGSDPTVMADGTIGYTIIGYADTVRDAQIFLFGEEFVRRYPPSQD